MANDILIVDDEADIRDLVAGILDDEGFTTRTARDSDSALAEIANRRPHLVFLDIWLQGSKLDGLQLLEQIKKDHADVPVVMISGHGNIETAVAAIKRGAYDFIEKPFKSDRLILVATRALETSRLKREVKELKQLAPAASVLTGRSACMNQLRQTIERAAKANSRILIVGPSGAGKELAARTLHNASARAEGPFVVINAAAITPERMEVELFGIEQSNGEQQRKAGALEEAHGGTLFIDEIGDMPRETQNKILRVLVDQTFQRSGGTTKVHVDVRIISSTARNLEEEIAEGRFREDLYHRLVGGADPGAAAVGTARGYPRTDRLFHGSDLGRDRLAEAPDRPGCDGGIAVACLARQRPPASQQRRTRDDSGERRSGGHHHGRYAAAGCRLDGAGDADQQQWRTHHGPAAARGAGGIRARLFDRADQPFLRQYLSHSGIRRHGALGAASQAQGARRRLGNAQRVHSMHLLEKIHLFPWFYGELHQCSVRLTRELACLKSAPAF